MGPADPRRCPRLPRPVGSPGGKTRRRGAGCEAVCGVRSSLVAAGNAPQGTPTAGGARDRGKGFGRGRRPASGARGPGRWHGGCVRGLAVEVRGPERGIPLAEAAPAASALELPPRSGCGRRARDAARPARRPATAGSSGQADRSPEGEAINPRLARGGLARRQASASPGPRGPRRHNARQRAGRRDPLHGKEGAARDRALGCAGPVSRITQKPPAWPGDGRRGPGAAVARGGDGPGAPSVTPWPESVTKTWSRVPSGETAAALGPESWAWPWPPFPVGSPTPAAPRPVGRRSGAQGGSPPSRRQGRRLLGRGATPAPTPVCPGAWHQGAPILTGT